MFGEVKLGVFGLQVLGETRGHSVTSLPPRRSHSLLLGHAWCCIRGSGGAPGQCRHQSFVSCLRPVPGGRNCGGSLPFLPLLWSCCQPAIPACSPGVSSKPDLGQRCAVGDPAWGCHQGHGFSFTRCCCGGDGCVQVPLQTRPVSCIALTHRRNKKL